MKLVRGSHVSWRTQGTEWRIPFQCEHDIFKNQLQWKQPISWIYLFKKEWKEFKQFRWTHVASVWIDMPFGDKCFLVLGMQLQLWLHMLLQTRQTNSTISSSCEASQRQALCTLTAFCAAFELILRLTSVVQCPISSRWSFQPENSWIWFFAHVVLKIYFWEHI